jgi:amino acid transporter
MIGPETVPLTSTPLPAAVDLGTAALLLIYAYVGFEGAVVPAGETRNPARDMPRALILGLAVVTLLYVLLQAVSVAVLPGLAESDSPLLDVAAELMGPVGAMLLMAGVLASVGGNLVGSIFSSPRMTYALARDGSLPAWFGAVHPRYETPANSVIFYGVFAFLLAAFGSFTWLAVMGVLVRLFMYMASIAALPILRRRHRDAPDRFVLPGGYAIPVLAIVSCVGLLTQVGLDSYIVTGVFLLLGFALYAAARRARPSTAIQRDAP